MARPSLFASMIGGAPTGLLANTVLACAVFTTFQDLQTKPLASQGVLKGTNLRGQTEPKRRSSLSFADSRLFLENKAFGETQIFAENRRFSQETAENSRNLQKTADWGLSP